MKPNTRASRFLPAAALLAAALAASSCSTNVGDGDQPGIYTVRVTEKLDGTEANAKCENPSVSADGRFVVFQSDSITLAPNDSNEFWKTDIFLKDRTDGSIKNLTLLNQGMYGPYPDDCFNPVISANGRYVAFESNGVYMSGVLGGGGGKLNIWRYDRQTGQFNSVQDYFDWPSADLLNPSISADGRYVAFESSANNLVPGVTPGSTQVWVADFSGVVNPADHAVVTLVSRAVTNTSPPTPADSGCTNSWISGDGSSIVFQSGATNLVSPAPPASEHIYLGTNAGDPLELISVDSSETPYAGASSHPSVSGDGRYVAFYSLGFAGGGVMRRDRVTTTTDLVADDAGLYGAYLLATDRCSISSDGQTIAYTAGGTGSGLVTRVRRMSQSTPFTVSVHLSGAYPQLMCEHPVLSADGNWVVFQSAASNLVLGDTNGFDDLFVRGPLR